MRLIKIFLLGYSKPCFQYLYNKTGIFIFIYHLVDSELKQKMSGIPRDPIIPTVPKGDADTFMLYVITHWGKFVSTLKILTYKWNLP